MKHVIIIFLFADCFLKATKAVKAKTIDLDSGKLIGCQMLSSNNCAV